MAQGQLRKMLAGTDPAAGGPVRYALRVGEAHVDLAPFIGKEFTLRFTGQMTCVNCGRTVKKFFGQGFCYPCFSTAPEAAECIVRPELCRAHLGEGRDPAWETAHHAQEHVVYLSQTGGIKVGVTRSTQVPVRWIDQGAVAALVIARVPYRQLAGLIEVALKSVFADRTNWRAMLTEVRPEPERLVAARAQALAALTLELGAYSLDDQQPMVLAYPVEHMPPKVTSVGLEKVPVISGRLAGAKGQYLIWSDGRVFNVRNNAGYHVEVAGS
jgi:hypothetical protein